MGLERSPAHNEDPARPDAQTNKMKEGSKTGLPPRFRDCKAEWAGRPVLLPSFILFVCASGRAGSSL